MMVLNELVTAYLEKLQPPSEALFAEMEAYAATANFPIVGSQVGRLLAQLAALHQPRRIFELGSGFGYSACWFLQGAPRSDVTCTEWKRTHIERGRTWMAGAGLLERVTWHEGDGVDLLRGAGRFDLILNDAEKRRYPEIFPLALEHLEPGGLLITDNLLWHGRVADPACVDEETEAIRTYNRLLFHTPGVSSTILPLRDGVGLTVKLPVQGEA